MHSHPSVVAEADTALPERLRDKFAGGPANLEEVHDAQDDNHKVQVWNARVVV